MQRYQGRLPRDRSPRPVQDLRPRQWRSLRVMLPFVVWLDTGPRPILNTDGSVRLEGMDTRLARSLRR